MFGCQAWAIVDPDDKLEARGEECVFLGYPKYSKSYKLWSLKRNKVIRYRDVIFREDTFPFKIRGKVGPYKREITSYRPREEDENNWAIDLEQESGKQTPGTGEVSNREHEEETRDVLSDYEQEREPPEASNETGQVNEHEEVQVPVPEREVRRSARHRREKNCNGCVGCNVVSTREENEEPATAEEVLNSKYRVEWKKAMEEELRRIEETDTLELAPRPREKRVIGLKWILKIKRTRKETLRNSGQDS